MHDPLLDYLDHLRLRNCRPSTIISRRDLWLRVETAIGKPLLTANDHDLKQWQRHLKVAPTTMVSYVTGLASMFRWAADDGRISDDPTTVLVRPKLPRRLPRPISEPSLHMAILGAPHRIKAMLILAAWQGCRAREIANLQAEDVLLHADPPLLIIRDSKGGKDRALPLTRTAIDALREHGLPLAGWVFPRHDGQWGPNQPWTVSSLCNRYLHSLGITETLHSLRHRALSELYRASGDLLVVADFAGHQSLNSSRGYVAYSNRRTVAAVRALDRLRPAAH